MLKRNWWYVLHQLSSSLVFYIYSFKFGGTVALGLLVSVTLLFAMTANLLLLPSLLLSLEELLQRVHLRTVN